MISKNPSPLRYPGGKTSLAGVIEAVLYANNLQGGRLVEPFAGGAGASLKLLFGGHVDQIVINDADPAIYAFWSSVMNNAPKIVGRIQSCELTIVEWQRQREIYRKPKAAGRLNLGFSTFYLNRCNRSGIVANGGPIGGTSQNGRWKIDARFNREELSKRIRDIADYEDRVLVENYDAAQLLSQYDREEKKPKTLIYADPPYYLKGGDLYLNHFQDADHVAFAEVIKKTSIPWVMTYDDHPRIREIYSGMQIIPFDLRYSANLKSKKGGELLIAPHSLNIPESALEELSSRG